MRFSRIQLGNYLFRMMYHAGDKFSHRDGKEGITAPKFHGSDDEIDEQVDWGKYRKFQELHEQVVKNIVTPKRFTRQALLDFLCEELDRIAGQHKLDVSAGTAQLKGGSSRRMRAWGELGAIAEVITDIREYRLEE